MKLLCLNSLLLIAVLLIVDFEFVFARGRGGGARGGSRGGRSPSRSRSRSSSGSRSPSITRTTKMPVTTYKSPVIYSQTRYVSSSSRYPKYIAAGAVTYYALSHAPVYRGYYPMYGCHVRVPQNRGVRVKEERQEIVNRYTNERCYPVTTKQADGSTPSRDSSYSEEPTNKELENFVNSTTTITYNEGTKTVFFNSTSITLDDNKVDEDFTTKTVTDYDKDISGTQIQGNCTRVVTTTTATMIRVYEYNPNSALILPATSLVLLVVIAFISFKIMQ